MRALTRQIRVVSISVSSRIGGNRNRMDDDGRSSEEREGGRGPYHHYAQKQQQGEPNLVPRNPASPPPPTRCLPHSFSVEPISNHKTLTFGMDTIPYTQNGSNSRQRRNRLVPGVTPRSRPSPFFSLGVQLLNPTRSARQDGLYVCGF